jgi:RND superfamily putative drug exporter
VLGAWLIALIVAVGASQALGSKFNETFSLPHTDSQAAVTLLGANFPAASNESDQIVVEAQHGASIRSPTVRRRVVAALTKVARVDGVESVISPYTRSGAGQISRDGTVAFATVTWDTATANVTKAKAMKLIAAAESADSTHLHVSLAGNAIDNSESSGVGLSVAVAVVAALAILLIVFGGALLASLLPLLTAAVALLTATSIIGLWTHLFGVSSDASDLAVLIGLGVGVDYGLFIISRYRGAIKRGASYEAAATEAIRTSGRTVLFAGVTVCVALLGLFALGVSYLNAVSACCAVTVALTIVGSLTFLPAMLALVGPRALSRRERAALAEGRELVHKPGIWLRWARAIDAHQLIVALASLAVVIALALPIFALQLGSSDDSTAPTSYTSRQAYVALARGFGPGSNGPFELVGKLASHGDVAAFGRLLTVASRTSGVASVTPTVVSPNRRVAIATLYPAAGPHAMRTQALLSTLRDHLIPRVEHGTTLTVHVGGFTATNVDFVHILTSKLPVFIVMVVLLAFVLLTVVFRSPLIALVGSTMNLLSFGAAMAAMAAVFNWGWAGSFLGLSGTGPVDVFIPVVIFSILFGLSMDYEVYLLSRIREEWLRPAAIEQPAHIGLASRAARHHHAVVLGQASSEPVIAAAAGIMILVFASFLLTKEYVLREFGFGLGFAVLVDVLMIRSLLVPAVTHLTGVATWHIPRWLDRMLPGFSTD